MNADICGRCMQTDRKPEWMFECEFLYTRTQHLNLFYICMMPSNAWSIAHSFAHSIACLFHAHKHTYGDFTYVYATLPSIQLHLQRNNTKKQLLSRNQCNYSTQNNQKHEFSLFQRRKKIIQKKSILCHPHWRRNFLSTATYSEQCPICMIAGKFYFGEKKFSPKIFAL